MREIGIDMSQSHPKQLSRATLESLDLVILWDTAHLFVCFIPYLLHPLLELEARKEMPGIMATKALDRLRRFTELATRRRFTRPADEDPALLSRVSGVS